MTPRTLEIGPRAYALRFTAGGILRAQEAAGVPFSRLLRPGAANTCALLYCALCQDLPHLTLAGAAALLKSALQSGLTAQEIQDALLAALDDSGFDAQGVTREEVERLLAAAARAGYPAPETLCDMTLREIDRALESFCARRALLLGRRPQPFAMTDGQMASALLQFARRQQHDHT